jgi:hypothetical protein
MDNDDIRFQPLTAWEIAVDFELRAVIFRLHSRAHAGAEPAAHSIVGASRADALRLATDLLAALRKLDAQAPAESGLEGSQRERQG